VIKMIYSPFLGRGDGGDEKKRDKAPLEKQRTEKRRQETNFSLRWGKERRGASIYGEIPLTVLTTSLDAKEEKGKGRGKKLRGNVHGWGKRNTGKMWKKKTWFSYGSKTPPEDWEKR